MYEGHYGQRIADNIKRSAPDDWIVEVHSLPRALPLVIDEPEEFLPSNLPEADLLLALSESPEAAQLIPGLARLSRAKAAIIPIDNSAWLPLGLRNQIRRELTNIGVDSVFPKTFCTLTEKEAGFGNDIEPYNSEYIARFASLFGRPKLRIQVDRGSGRIVKVEVQRSAPCGSTHLVAEKLIGVHIKEAVPQAGLHAHHYPCLASMNMEPAGDTLMHISGYVVNEEVEREIELFLKTTNF
jgi:hypothetical protein